MVSPSWLSAAGAFRANPSSRIAKGLALVCAAAVLMLAFAHVVDLRQALSRLQHLDPVLAALCGMAFLGAYVARALRWRCFLPRGCAPTRHLIAIYQVATFLNWLIPVQAGELAKALLLRRVAAVPLAESLPAVAMDKVMDLLPVLVLVVALPLLPFGLSSPLWWLLGLVLLLLLAAVAVVALAWTRRALVVRLTSSVAAKLPTPLRAVEPAALRFLDALVAMGRRPGRLARAAVFSAAAVGLDSLFALLAFRAIGVSLSFPAVLFGYTLFNLSFILPTLPGQIGSNELIGLLIFAGMLHVDRSGVAAMFLFSHPWTALLMAGSAVLSLASLGLTLRTTLQLTRQQA